MESMWMESLTPGQELDVLDHLDPKLYCPATVKEVKRSPTGCVTSIDVKYTGWEITEEVTDLSRIFRCGSFVRKYKAWCTVNVTSKIKLIWPGYVVVRPPLKDNKFALDFLKSETRIYVQLMGAVPACLKPFANGYWIPSKQIAPFQRRYQHKYDAAKELTAKIKPSKNLELLEDAIRALNAHEQSKNFDFLLEGTLENAKSHHLEAAKKREEAAALADWKREAKQEKEERKKGTKSIFIKRNFDDFLRQSTSGSGCTSSSGSSSRRRGGAGTKISKPSEAAISTVGEFLNQRIVARNPVEESSVGARFSFDIRTLTMPRGTEAEDPAADDRQQGGDVVVAADNDVESDSRRASDTHHGGGEDDAEGNELEKEVNRDLCVASGGGWEGSSASFVADVGDAGDVGERAHSIAFGLVV